MREERRGRDEWMEREREKGKGGMERGERKSISKGSAHHERPQESLNKNNIVYIYIYRAQAA
jgi:hypothetical protein